MQRNNHGYPHTDVGRFLRGLISLSVLVLLGCSSGSSKALNKENACRDMRAMELVTSSSGLRQYSVYFPKGFDQSAPPTAAGFPILYAFHGFYGSSTGFAMQVSGGQLCELADRENLIVVFPQGSFTIADESLYKQGTPGGVDSGFISSWNFLPREYYGPDFQANTVDGLEICNLDQLDADAAANGYVDQGIYPPLPGCNVWDKLGCSWTTCNQDVDFILELQDHMLTRYRGDPERQHLLGYSNGSMMVSNLACEHPERFASAVANSGTTASDQNGEIGMLCDRERLAEDSVSLLMLSGANDYTVPIRDRDYPGPIGSGTPVYNYFLKMSSAAEQLAVSMECRSFERTWPAAYQEDLGAMECFSYGSCGKEKTDTVEYCIWGLDPESAIASGGLGGANHVYLGCDYGGGFCVETSVQGDITYAPGQEGYPECLVDNRSPWGCSTDKGTQFIWEFLNKNHESP